MKLLFSEATPDYAHYQFPYVVWALPEAGERAADLYERGFLQSSGDPPRYYLSRGIRVDLAAFQPSSENRRILRKCADVELEILPRSELTPDQVDMCLRCGRLRYGNGVIGEARLAQIVRSPQTTHIIDFRRGGETVGLVTAHIDPPDLAHYQFAFYEVELRARSLGMFMMTSALVALKARDLRWAYLGSCYSRRALYKTQFKGVQFFNGVRWSPNLQELKYLIDRTDAKDPRQHLLESNEYLARFAAGALDDLARTSMMHVMLG